MASNLRVDTILPSTGTTLGIGTASGTINFLGNSNIDTSGTLTAASASITGNLGVGGTLTYEDVTNIDSVGVITARSGIDVTSGNIAVSSNGANVSPSGFDFKIRSNTGKLGIHIDNASGTPTLEFGIGGATGGAITTNSTGPIVLKPNNSERLRITHNGEIGIGGANYGTSGQVLTSQGASSAVQWATPGYGVFEVKHGSSAQSIPRVTYTKVEFKTETYDLDGLFDTTTYRYTPQVAGYYYVAFNVILTGQASGYEIYAEIKKNGSSVMKSHSGGSQNYGSLSQADVYGIVQCNGSSDYLDAYLWHNNANSASRSPDVNMTRMLGYLVRRT